MIKLYAGTRLANEFYSAVRAAYWLGEYVGGRVVRVVRSSESLDPRAINVVCDDADKLRAEVAEELALVERRGDRSRNLTAGARALRAAK